LLAANAMVQAADGELDAALESTGQIYDLAAHLGGEPTLISQLVAIAMVSIANQANVGLMHHDPTYEQLRIIADQAMAAETAFSIKTGIIGERCLGHDVFNTPDALAAVAPASLVRTSAATVYGATGLKGGDNANYLKILAAYSAALDLPPEARLAAANKVEEEHISKLSKINIFSNMLLPGLTASVSKDTRILTKLRHIQYAAAALMHADTHDELPDSLGELSYDWLKHKPVDLFTGQTLIYERGDEGFVIFSPGENLKDDRGKKVPKRLHRADDIVTRVTR
jgi:hypothetical protein